MAGAPERPFAPGGKDRLGNYSLTKLLRAIQEGKAKEKKIGIPVGDPLILTRV